MLSVRTLLRESTHCRATTTKSHALILCSTLLTLSILAPAPSLRSNYPSLCRAADLEETWLTESDCDPMFLAVDTIAPTFEGPVVCIADVDSDGDNDIVGASELSASICWWENDGSANFTKHIVDSSFTRPYSVFSCDLDSDGDIDLLACGHEPRVAWFEHLNDGTFVRQIIDSTSCVRQSIGAIDLDGDEDLDVYAAAWQACAEPYSWWENDGGENFVRHTLPSDPDIPRMIISADIDSDLDMDLIAAGDSLSETPWWENDGTGGFTLHTIPGVVWGVESVHPTDLDQDDDIDIVAVTGDVPDGLIWWKNDGSENFSKHTVSDPGAGHWVDIGDVDGDGDLDIVAQSWWENDGNENFIEHTIPNHSHTSSVHVASIGAECSMDIVSASWFTDMIAWWQNECDPPPCLVCPNQGDIEPDGFITALDLAAVIDALFASGENPQDPDCPTLRFDLDCDDFTTALDLSSMIDYLFAGGEGLCDPCCSYPGLR